MLRSDLESTTRDRATEPGLPLPHSFASGVAKRGTTFVSPSQDCSRSASASISANGVRAHVLEEPVRDLSVRAPSPAADDAAVPPDRRARVPVPVEQRRPVLAEIPGALLPAHHGRVERRAAARPTARAQARARGRPGRTNPGAPSRSTSTAPIASRALRASAAERPPAPPLEVGDGRRAEGGEPARRELGARGFGLERRERRLRTTTAAGDQHHWLLVHAPRGRPRTIRPSAASRNSTQVVIARACSPTSCPRRSAMLLAQQRDVGGQLGRDTPAPRASERAQGRSAASSSHARPSVAMPPLFDQLRVAPARRGSAIDSVQAAFTTAARSSGRTNSVRRIPIIRRTLRSS